MEKKVLLLTDFYMPNNNANGLCMHRIGKAMQKLGYEVHVIAYLEKGLLEEEILDGIYVHRVWPLFFYRMREYYYKHTSSWKGKFCWMTALAVRRTKKILFMPWYPLVSPLATARYCRKARETANRNQICNVIAGYNPFEAAAACVSLKKKRPDWKVIAYFMDTFTLTANAKNSKLIYNRGRRWEEKIYQSADMITNFPIYREYFDGKLYDKYRKKMDYADVPIDFHELTNGTDTGAGNSDGISLVYTGGLKMGEREPNYLLNLFSGMDRAINCSLHFYGKGDAEEYIAGCRLRDVYTHGYVSFEELRTARENADFMVNVGSQRETILPSRLLEHIASGKPIIHINYRPDDPCVGYLKKHPCALILNVKDDYQENFQKFQSFITEKKGVLIDRMELEQRYCESSAAYIAQMFDRVFEAKTN